jgi:hypothetical protein
MSDVKQTDDGRLYIDLGGNKSGMLNGDGSTTPVQNTPWGAPP